MRDSLKRSIVKSIVWRILGLVILGFVSWWAAITFRDNLVNLTLATTLVFNGIRLILYVAHEQIWEHIDWGRNGCTIHKKRIEELEERLKNLGVDV